MLIKSTSVVLVGGGLSNCLNASFLSLKHPSTHFHIIDSGKDKLPSKTWSFHLTDIQGFQSYLQSLISKQWDAYDVYFPSYQRTVNIPYASIRPSQLFGSLKNNKQVSFHFEQSLQQLSKNTFLNQQGQTVVAQCVLDGTGKLENQKNGYQKFVGLHVKLKKPHGLKRPILMDARIPQTDGFRFMYVLPWSEDELLIEETHYSDSPDIPFALYESEILNYLQTSGWMLDEIQSRESGCLPIPFDLKTPSEDTLTVGVKGHFFHPVTGYSLPYAVQTAAALADLDSLSADSVQQALRTLRKQQAQQQSFFLLLNRLMFQSAKPEERYKIFEHFYSFNESFIQRFYRGDMTVLDRVRIFIGKPPVPVLSALPIFLSFKDAK